MQSSETLMLKINTRFILFVLLALMFVTTVSAKVVLSPLFSNNMVLQQKDKVAIWGKSTANKSVIITTSWNRKKYNVVTDATGSFNVKVTTPKAGGPYNITFSDGDITTLSDILIGEVWICSGQSNMEMGLEGFGKVKNYKEEVAAANYPNIRLLKVEKATSTQPLTDAKFNEGWQVCSPETVRQFSAVAYFFARNFLQHHNVPIGLIQSAYSGTPAQSWVSGRALKAIPSYDTVVKVISRQAGSPKDSHIPSVLFNAMINPLIPYGIRGVIWYQGESNDKKAQQYKTLFPLLINDWRSRWKKQFPFYYVQLANFTEVLDKPAESTWAELREAQFQTLQVPKTGMAVAIDIGEAKDIHPKNKQDVGMRLALIARSKVYRENIAYYGPMYNGYKIQGDKIQVSFKHIERGLKAKSDTLKGFAIAGDDKEFYWAHAKIEGDKVLVWSDAVKMPVAVRYGWANNPVCNLYNKAGLPASPFRTDTWKGITE